MTTYRVVVEPRAPAAAAKWFNGLTSARDSLRRHPARCAVVSGGSLGGTEIRQLLYGRRRNRYRLLFTIRGDSVHILRVIHGARVTGETDP